MRVKGLHDTCHRLDVFSTPFQQPRFSELWHALALPHVLFGGTVWVRGRRRLAFFLNPTPSQKRYGMRRYGTVYNVDPFDLYRHLHPYKCLSSRFAYGFELSLQNPAAFSITDEAH